MTTTIETPGVTEADLKATAALVDGLHTLADMVQAHPELIDRLGFAFANMCAPVGVYEDPRAEIAALTRATLDFGGTVTKHYSASQGGVDLHFGSRIAIRVVADRDQVCERVSTGVTTVTREIPDPTVNVPTVTVTEEIETFEWQCLPLLATTGTAATS